MQATLPSSVLDNPSGINRVSLAASLEPAAAITKTRESPEVGPAPICVLLASLPAFEAAPPDGPELPPDFPPAALHELLTAPTRRWLPELPSDSPRAQQSAYARKASTKRPPAPRMRSDCCASFSS